MVARVRLSSLVVIGSSKQDFAGIVDSNFVNSGTVVGVNSARDGISKSAQWCRTVVRATCLVNGEPQFLDLQGSQPLNRSISTW